MNPPSNHAGAAGSLGDSVQTTEPWEEIVDAAIERWRSVPGGLMPLLHDVQDALGWIPPAARPRIARGINLSEADVHGVVTFYHDFRSSPPGRHVLKVCRAEACQAMGAEELAVQLEARSGAGFGGTTPDGAVTVEAVYCLGNCACAPSVMIDGRLVGRVTVERLGRIVKAAKASPSPRAEVGS
jgi:formate dehydrogenase subunit gamma